MYRSFVSWGPPILKFLQNLLLSYNLVIYFYHSNTHTHNLTIMNYLSYSKHYYSNKLLTCHSLPAIMPFPPPARPDFTDSFHPSSNMLFFW